MTTAKRAELRDLARSLFDAAVRSVDPCKLVVDQLRADPTLVEEFPLTVVAAGKAAAAMANGCETALPAADWSGHVIAPRGLLVPALPHCRVDGARHPLPDEAGVAATRRILQLLDQKRSGAVLCLLSGGASSLLVSPRAPVELEDKVAVTRQLLDSGATIDEINTIRKHISTVKGGGLWSHCHVALRCLIISDVVGNDPATIASGPTCADPTSFADAYEVLRKYQLLNDAPLHVSSLLQAGMRGEIAETTKDRPPGGAAVENRVIGSNAIAVQAAAQAAKSRGWQVAVEDKPVQGDTTAAARQFAHRLERYFDQSTSPGVCIIGGGETTVRVRGNGRGGRNQEFALALAEPLRQRNALILSAGTDGVDGPTPAAGAFVDGETLDRASSLQLDPDRALRQNDSHTFFEALDDLLTTGPTGTNVMDLKIALLPAQR